MPEPTPTTMVRQKAETHAAIAWRRFRQHRLAIISASLLLLLFSICFPLAPLISPGLVDDPINFLGSTTAALPTLIVAQTWQFIPFGTLLILAALQTIPRALYDAMKRLMDDKELYARLCQGALNKRCNFDLDVWSERFVRYCRDAAFGGQQS